jgi:hypothetical protein
VGWGLASAGYCPPLGYFPEAGYWIIGGVSAPRNTPPMLETLPMQLPRTCANRQCPPSGLLYSTPNVIKGGEIDGQRPTASNICIFAPTCSVPSQPSMSPRWPMQRHSGVLGRAVAIVSSGARCAYWCQSEVPPRSD